MGEYYYGNDPLYEGSDSSWQNGNDWTDFMPPEQDSNPLYEGGSPWGTGEASPLDTGTGSPWPTGSQDKAGGFNVAALAKQLNDILSGKSDYGNLGRMAAFGGLAALLRKAMPAQNQAVGYQGKIPRYTASRQQLAIPTDRRPGQGGVRYFSDMQYAPAPPGAAAGGGIAALAAKGRFISGQGDGVSDHVPATIEGNQPARLADGEFVLPARIVAEIGNGSSAAGARKLYDFMDRVERMTRNAKRGKPSGADRLLNKLA